MNPLKHSLAEKMMQKFWLLGLSLSLYLGFANSEVVPVPFFGTDSSASFAPTMTWLWEANSPKATLVFFPGGEGRLGLTPERKALGGFYGATLKPLSDSSLTSGSMNVVVFDSPAPLPVGSNYPVSRQNNDHLRRIESVVRFYKENYGLPIVLMGHSNGAASITEFYKLAQTENKTDLIAGAVYSSARNYSTFNEKTCLPILFFSLLRDGCAKSTPYQSNAVYEAQRRTNTQKLNYVLIRGGEAQSQDPCYSGFHMFYGASEEAYKAIDTFFSSPR
jgi:hypothetical protein